MILYISDRKFKKIMTCQQFHLPMRWDGADFERTVSSLLEAYKNKLHGSSEHQNPMYDSIKVDEDLLDTIISLLIRCIHKYHQGFPSDAFEQMDQLMNILIAQPLKIYQKSSPLYPLESDILYLFRLRSVNDKAKHTRKELFHVPACARSNISTCRYSIAGYPSLYLTTSIELGKEELGNATDNLLVCRYQLRRLQQELNIRVLELGIRPQDFCGKNSADSDWDSHKIDLQDISLGNRDLCTNYLLWYPLIAACSFIRVNKSAPFSSEYIVPQLLMQWVRKQTGENELMGIRYFSCASQRASELGFDYVFPVNNTNWKGGYCSVLRDSFKLSEPVYLEDFSSAHHCEQHLIAQKALKQI